MKYTIKAFVKIFYYCLCLSLCLSVSSVCLSVFCLSLSSVCLSLSLSLPVSVSVCLSVCLSVSHLIHSALRSLQRTAGRAKKDIPRIAENEAMTFPPHVVGTTSPYPTVHSVTCNTNNIDSGWRIHFSLSKSSTTVLFSNVQTAQ